MAHKLSIPIEFSCEIERSVWVVGTACPVKWIDKVYGAPTIELKVTSPACFAGLTQRCIPECLPRELLESLFPGEESLTKKVVREKVDDLFFAGFNPLSKEIRKAKIEVLIGNIEQDLNHAMAQVQPDEAIPKLVRKVDPWALRRDFLALDGSTAGLANFLNRYGSWDGMNSPRFTQSKNGFFWKPVIVLPLGIWNDREEIKIGLAAGASAWFANYKAVRQFFARSKFPHYYHTDTLCADAINTATTIDFLRQVKFSICPRVDCGTPFPAERKGKIYCSQYCAHLVSLRKSRKKQQSLRRKEK